MSIGALVIIHSILFIVVIGALINTIVNTIKIRGMEAALAKLLNDSGKLKKVSVGNYLDIIRVKKRIGMEVDEPEKTGDTENS